jgi:hypothetical protein
MFHRARHSDEFVALVNPPVVDRAMAVTPGEPIDRMIPRLRRRAWMLVPLAWALMTALQLITVKLANRPIGLSGWTSVATQFPIDVLTAMLLFVLTVRVRDWPPSRRLWTLVPAIALAAICVGFVFAIKDIALMDWLEPQPHMALPAMWLASSTNTALFFGVLVTLFTAWIEGARRAADASALVEAREAEARARLTATRAEAAATEARLAALRYQLNPHFLFNTLNAISSMVVTGRNQAAEGMLDKLCEFLRTTLSGRPEALVPLEDELATIASYLEIEAFRLRERLTVTFDCPSEFNHALVPGFLLQPLVENAIKHGVGATSRPVHLEIAVRREPHRVLAVTIVDDGGADSPCDAPAGFGVGLTNVAERLRSLFGDEGALTVEQRDPGFAATVRIPLAIERALERAGAEAA